MAKKDVQQIQEVTKYLTKDNLLPIYFLCGEDSYAIDKCVEEIEKTVAPLIQSDFDREIFSGEKSTDLSSVFDFALAFPFGGEKKLIILQDFDKISDKKELLGYLSSYADFTILVITHPAKVQDYSREPFSTLVKNNFLFEAKPLKGEELVKWLIKTSYKMGLSISQENAQVVIEIVGEQKELLEMQLHKFLNYIPKGADLTLDDIKKLASPTKEYSIFDLLDSLGKGNKAASLKVGFNLLDNGMDMVFILNMVAKFILTISQIFDLSKERINDYEAAKLAGTSYYYYINCKKAQYFMSDERLYNASKALLNADISVKTTSSDQRTTFQILVSEILGSVVSQPYTV